MDNPMDDENYRHEQERLLWEHREGRMELLNLAKAELARTAGSTKSQAKSEAARENGKKGGRPKSK